MHDHKRRPQGLSVVPTSIDSLSPQGTSQNDATLSSAIEAELIQANNAASNHGDNSTADMLFIASVACHTTPLSCEAHCRLGNGANKLLHQTLQSTWHSYHAAATLRQHRRSVRPSNTPCAGADDKTPDRRTQSADGSPNGIKSSRQRGTVSKRPPERCPPRSKHLRCQCGRHKLLDYELVTNSRTKFEHAPLLARRAGLNATTENHNFGKRVFDRHGQPRKARSNDQHQHSVLASTLQHAPNPASSPQTLQRRCGLILLSMGVEKCATYRLESAAIKPRPHKR